MKERPRSRVSSWIWCGKRFSAYWSVKSLEEMDIEIDMISGSSAGALIGGLYCTGISPK